MNEPIDIKMTHPRCIVCSSVNDRGLHARFRPSSDGGVEATFACDKAFQGYEGKLHGGVIAALLDGAMTHCLFTRGKAAVTAELTVRYRLPVAVDRMATVRAWVAHASPRLQRVRAELIQDDVIKAAAWAKFMDDEPHMRRGQNTEIRTATCPHP